MVQLTVEERVLLVTTYLRTGRLEARNAFRDRFADREPPTKMTVSLYLSIPQGKMHSIFIMTETTVAQKSLSGLDYARMEHLQAHSFMKVM